ncbi:low-specificity L-threonine aldolase [Halalkalibacter wakoensis JCM 9140]|uniref:Low-specificity L-threonine aldolase n=1 Tax=Halalkalibacter wakoensis JCM 9140 TaxID=1236970 RepID=W4Q109_9BACI|nr:low-specificity L-threonine aldolase [Halalkalibacter wakoensis JCM 9140]
MPVSNMEAVYKVAKENQVPVHLDGARLFNAAVAERKLVKDYTQYTSTVQICLSKGLGAPVGSIIAGSESFIEKARKWRKRLGGGLRQAGVLAAPGIIALTDMVERLEDDHIHAKRLANGIRNIEGLSVINKVDTNIILVDTSEKGLSSKVYIERLKEKGVRAVSFGPTTVRLTTHHQVTKEQIDKVLFVMQGI